MFEEQKKIYDERVHLGLKRIGGRIHLARVPLEVAAWHVRGEPVASDFAMCQVYEPFAVGGRWGGLWDTTWFRFRGTVPVEWAGREVVALVRLTDFDYEGFTAEGLIYQEGKLQRALNANRREVPIAAKARGGEDFEFFVEAAANGGADRNGFLPGLCQPDYLGEPRYALCEAQLACVDREVFDYYYDFKTALEAMEVFPENSQRRAELCRALNESLGVFDAEAGATRSAREILKGTICRKNGGTAHTVSGVGHGHIDTAWLWPLREAIRKCARTFSTALDYMERYPEYVFACSQPQHYLWMKVHYPEIWEKIRAAVKRGQWEPVGSMWVEADCNLPSGESLVRQMLHGKRFFLREFGLETRDVWLPDVFGYPATLPQIIRGAGADYFMTQKMSWNQFNVFPHHSFLWEGIDGSKVFTHFPPTGTYSADTGPGDLAKTAANFREHGLLTRSMLLYGHGDGGGGPSIEMLEKARRLGDFDGLPRLELEKSAAFFEKAEAEFPHLPEWFGELYLEVHRGTYTTQARNKLHNRRSEFLMREAEFFDCVAWLVDPTWTQTTADPPRAVYDVGDPDAEASPGAHKGALERAWKLILLNQFHDIIPGSSIHWVYEDSERDYAVIRKLGESVRASGGSALASQVDVSGLRQPVLVSNPLGFARREVVDLPEKGPAWVEVPPCGYTVRDLAADSDSGPEHRVRATESDGGFLLENGLIQLLVTKDGALRSVKDLRCDREVLAPGEDGNALCLYNDIPNRHDAWEIEFFSLNTHEIIRGLEKIAIVENSPLRCALEITRSFGRSRVVQRVILRAGSARIDFATEVDWREDRKCLKVAFPVNVRSGHATYDIQFGHVERPTHANTSWDMAKFEVCAHQWADLSESGFGVALLNDCKYGYDVHGNTLRLTLLRAPMSPDPLADRGRHCFTYALLSHEGNFRTGAVIEEAAALNAPLWSRPVPVAERVGGLPLTHSFLQCDSAGLRIEAFKKAEDGDALIVRLSESHGARGRTTLRLGFSAETACLTDLLERDIQPLEISNGKVSIPFQPFQILTIKITGLGAVAAAK